MVKILVFSWIESVVLGQPRRLPAGMRDTFCKPLCECIAANDPGDRRVRVEPRAVNRVSDPRSSPLEPRDAARQTLAEIG